MDFYDLSQPAWSPDGKRIAFKAGDQIYIYTLADKSRHKITLNERDGAEPAWSSDSNYVFFRSERGNTDFDIYKARYDANPAIPLSHKKVIVLKGNDTLVVSSPNGSKIAFQHQSDTDPVTYDVMTANADGSNPNLIYRYTGRIDRLSWFPDSDRILLRLNRNDGITQGHLRIVRVTTKTSNPIVGPNDKIRLACDAVISLDGTKIAFSAIPEGSDGFCIYTCSLGGMNLKQITKAP